MEELAEAMYEALVAKEIDRIQQQFPGEVRAYSYASWKSLSPDQQHRVRVSATDFLIMSGAYDLRPAQIEESELASLRIKKAS